MKGGRADQAIEFTRNGYHIRGIKERRQGAGLVPLLYEQPKMSDN